MTSSTKKNTERKRTSDDESVNDISTAAAAARKRAKKEGEQLLQKQPISASLAVTRTIEMPSGFVPFLLRANGLKLANIEANSKTRIQVEQGRQRKGAPLDEKHDTELANDSEKGHFFRRITIKGAQERHCRTAEILMQKMYEAYSRKETSVSCGPKTKKHEARGDRTSKGKGGRGKGGRGKGGRGKGGRGKDAEPFGAKGAKGNGSGLGRGKGNREGKGKGRDQAL